MNDQNHNDHSSGADEERPAESHKEIEVHEYRLVPVKDSQDFGEDEKLDLLAVAKEVWDQRRILYVSLGIFLFFSLFIYLVKPEVYRTDSQLLPEADLDSNTGRLVQQFGGLFGIGGGATSEGIISVKLYPKIVESLPFQLDLLEEPLYFSSIDTTLSLYQYYTTIAEPSFYHYLKKYTIGVNSLEAQMFVSRKRDVSDTTVEGTNGFNGNTYVLTGSRRKIGMASDIVDLIDVQNTPDGTIEISGTISDPHAAAALVNTTANLLTKYIVNYRTEKAKDDLNFIQSQYQRAKQNFETAQQRLAEFRDSNLNMATERARTEEERLQAEYNLAFELYTNLAKQLQQSRIKVQQETPVFSMLEPAIIPSGSKQPQIETSFAIGLFLGSFMGLAIIFLRVLYFKYVDVLKQTFK